MIAADDCAHKIPDVFPAEGCEDCGGALCESRHPTRKIKCMQLAGHENQHFNRYDPQKETWE